MLLFVSYYIGTLVGFQKGTYLSLVLAAASIEKEEAVSSSIALGLIKENKQQKAVEFLENSLRRNINNYYQYLESEKEVKRALDENYILSRLNGFKLFGSPSLDAPAYYVRAYVTEAQIKNNEGYRLLLEEYPDEN
ncbi:MAG: hypothetical protein KZQ73_01165 [Candidatus Thiodiazotropha sp. (ex Semelilucina semeliformis)]|nr:hypothetical protein [Candidatus Thiodiazotropha sp. (ex Semelilucina semeliformis)]